MGFGCEIAAVAEDEICARKLASRWIYMIPRFPTDSRKLRLWSYATTTHCGQAREELDMVEADK